MDVVKQAENVLNGKFRRGCSPCPSEASSQVPSLASPPPPWVWPAHQVIFIITPTTITLL